MTQLFSFESDPNIAGLALDLLVPLFHIARTDCPCPHVLGLNDFKTIFSDKITGRNKYFNIRNRAKA